MWKGNRNSLHYLSQECITIHKRQCKISKKIFVCHKINLTKIKKAINKKRGFNSQENLAKDTNQINTFKQRSQKELCRFDD